MTRRDLARLEKEFRGAEIGPFDLRATDFRRRFHVGEVLTHQPRLRSLPANIRHAKRPPRDQRQRQRRPQQLPTAGLAGDGKDGGIFHRSTHALVGPSTVSKTLLHSTIIAG